MQPSRFHVIGAGIHSEKKDSINKKICELACTKGMDAIKAGKSAVDVVALATAEIENDPYPNAGLGSNLTTDGTVECDASLMDGDKLCFGAVAAVSKIKNPVLVARSLCLGQCEKLALDRTPPCFLVSSGAEKWAEEKGLDIVEPNDLITDRARKLHSKYMDRLKATSLPSELDNSTSENKLLDTVGVVAVDLQGRIAASCSSGGIILKSPGRVGQAALYGCGCWAQNYPCGLGIATSTSGCGEDLIRTSLAREVANSIINSNNATIGIRNTLSSFLVSPFLGMYSSKECGIISLHIYEGGRGEFTWGHTSKSMVIGYMSTKHKRPHSRVSRLSPDIKAGTTPLIEGVSI